MTKKIITGLIITLLFAFALPAFGSNESEIREDIEKLRKEIESLVADVGLALQSKEAVVSFPRIPPHFRFHRQMGIGAKGIDVMYMQIIFNSDPQTKVAVTGPGSFGQESSTFGPLTRNALNRFQAKYATEILHPWNITVPTGYAGMQTIKKLNRILEGEVIITVIPPSQTDLLLARILEIKREIARLRERIDNLGGGGSGGSGDGSIRCTDIRRNSITVSFQYFGGSAVSIFRENRLLDSWTASYSGSGTYNDEGLNEETTYTYFLREGTTTSSKLIDSVTCNTLGTGTPPPPPPPPPPIPGEGDIQSEVVAYGEVKLTWEDHPSADYYICSRAASATGGKTDVVAVKDVNSCVVTGALGKGNNYYFFVDMVTSNKQRLSVGNTGSVTMTRDRAPYNLTINVDNLGLALTWQTDASGVEEYQIWRAPALTGGGTSYQRIATVPGNTRRYVDLLMHRYAFYNYKVTQRVGGSWSRLEDSGPRMRSYNGALLGKQEGKGEVCPHPALMTNEKRREFTETPPNC